MKIKTEQDFIDKVRSMTAKEIVLAMVEGLENPVTEIDMDTFGVVKDEICYGCAATNAICRIAKISKEDFLKINPIETMRSAYTERSSFIQRFESAINRLRYGDIEGYNVFAYRIFSEIDEKDFSLPVLNNRFTKNELNEYKKFAELL